MGPCRHSGGQTSKQVLPFPVSNDFELEDAAFCGVGCGGGVVLLLVFVVEVVVLLLMSIDAWLKERSTAAQLNRALRPLQSICPCSPSVRCASVHQRIKLPDRKTCITPIAARSGVRIRGRGIVGDIFERVLNPGVQEVRAICPPQARRPGCRRPSGGSELEPSDKQRHLNTAEQTAADNSELEHGGAAPGGGAPTTRAASFGGVSVGK